MARGEVVLVVSYRICRIWFSFWWFRFACFGGVVSFVSVVSFRLFRLFRFVCFGGFVSFVSVVSFRLFRGFCFAVSGFCTCPSRVNYHA